MGKLAPALAAFALAALAALALAQGINPQTGLPVMPIGGSSNGGRAPIGGIGSTGAAPGLTVGVPSWGSASSGSTGSAALRPIGPGTTGPVAPGTVPQLTPPPGG